MRNQRNILFHIAMGSCLLAGYVGCATTSDLEKLRKRLTSDIAAATSQARAETRDLRGRLETLETRTSAAIDAEKRTLEVQASHTAGLEAKVEQVMMETSRMRTALDELSVKRSRDVEVIQSAAGDLRKQLTGVEQELATFSSSAQRLQGQVRTQSSGMQALIRALLRNYQSDMDILREHLKTMEQFERQGESPIRGNPQSIDK
jgi:chromosome segregation ATPase